MVFTIKSNRGCNTSFSSVEEDKDVSSSVHVEDFADIVDLASMGQKGSTYFHQAVYDMVLPAASIFESVFIFAQLEGEKSRVVLNIEGQRTMLFVVSYTRNEARLVQLRREELPKEREHWLYYCLLILVARLDTYLYGPGHHFLLEDSSIAPASYEGGFGVEHNFIDSMALAAKSWEAVLAEEEVIAEEFEKLSFQAEWKSATQKSKRPNFVEKEFATIGKIFAPTSTTNLEFQIVLGLIKDSLREQMVGLSPREAVEFLSIVEALAVQDTFLGGLFMVGFQEAKAAIEEGILPGGGVALLYAIKYLDKIPATNFDQKIGVVIIQNALKSPVHIISSNAGVEGVVVVGKQLEQENLDYGYDAAKGEYIDMIKDGTVDPLKVIKIAVVDATSVSSSVTTIEAMVVISGLNVIRIINEPTVATMLVFWYGFVIDVNTY
ncbi:hypothetical protein SUGI_1095250 [Cryptomeria japonica]|nr:hypothetical protein SUGI_1095250 [Cryptomeria japonica]